MQNFRARREKLRKTNVKLTPLTPLDPFQNGYLIGNWVIHTVFDKESESEVKKCKILEPGGEN